MTPERDGITELEGYFATARESAPELGSDLRARILADAARAQPRPAAPARAGRWREWLSGWALPGATGGALASLGGFWIGLAAPLPVDAPFWAPEALGVLDYLSYSLVGVIDPLAPEF